MSEQRDEKLDNFKGLHLFYNIAQIVTFRSESEVNQQQSGNLEEQRADEKYRLVVLGGQNVARQAILTRDGVIEKLDDEARVRSEMTEKEQHLDQEVDCMGGAVLPGFVDAHTHPVWAGDRLGEFADKLAGASYMEIHAKGGGIHFTVEKTREASEEELYQSLKSRLLQMLQNGTTSVECKTGYGLDWATELKMLRVLTRARRDPTLPIDLVITYLAAHAVPRNSNSSDFTADIINNQLPQLNEEIQQGHIDCHMIDVFCEKGVFNVEQTRAILKAGTMIKGINLDVNFHAEELSYLGGAELSAEFPGCGISHLEHVSKSALESMNLQRCSAILLPTTAYLLRLTTLPPARTMLDDYSNINVVLGSDFNPNAHCCSMPLVMNLACILMKMSMEEALAAATWNAARALRLSHKLGRLEVGFQADFLVLKDSRWENLIYKLGYHQDLIKLVIKKGKLAI